MISSQFVTGNPAVKLALQPTGPNISQKKLTDIDRDTLAPICTDNVGCAYVDAAKKSKGSTLLIIDIHF